MNECRFISYSYKSDVIYILEQYIWHFYTITGNYMGRFVKFKDKLLLEVLASISIFENKVYFESIWPDSLDHLAIGLIAYKCTKLAKMSKILLLSLGCPI